MFISLFNLKLDLQVRIAELLGVAGTDVPIAQIEKLIPPYKVNVDLGPNLMNWNCLPPVRI